MSNLTKKQVRHYELDLLRIVSMFLIIMLHVLERGGIMNGVQPGTVNGYLARFMKFAALGSVNCYAMLSGYFGAGKNNRFSSMGSLWLQVFVYSFGITLAGKLLGMNSTGLASSCFPVVTKQYWYFTAYVIVFLFAPVLNTAVEGLRVSQLAAVVVLGGIVFCSSGFLKDVFILNHGYSAHWLAYLYLTGGLLRRLGHGGKGWKFAVLYFGISLLSTLCYFLAAHYRWEQVGALGYYNSPLVFLSALCLFLFFANCKIKSNSLFAGFIGLVSPLCFGVYLIHTHPLVYRLMGKRFTFIANGTPVQLVLGVVGISAALFIGCAMIEWLRSFIFRLLHIKPLLQKLWDKGAGLLPPFSHED